jgi:hypothetical protein
VDPHVTKLVQEEPLSAKHHQFPKKRIVGRKEKKAAHYKRIPFVNSKQPFFQIRNFRAEKINNECKKDIVEYDGVPQNINDIVPGCYPPENVYGGDGHEQYEEPHSPVPCKRIAPEIPQNKHKPDYHRNFSKVTVSYAFIEKCIQGIHKYKEMKIQPLDCCHESYADLSGAKITPIARSGPVISVGK